MPTTLRLMTWNGKPRSIDLSKLRGLWRTAKGNLQLYFSDDGPSAEERNVFAWPGACEMQLLDRAIAANAKEREAALDALSDEEFERRMGFPRSAYVSAGGR